MIKNLWIAHLFSLKCTAPVCEFFELQKHWTAGMSATDPSLEEVSPTWKELRRTRPQLVEKESYLNFAHKVRKALRQGIHFTYPGLPDFPEELLTLQEVPFFLNYRGTPVWKKYPGIAVVGSREPSVDSEAWCEQELGLMLQRMPLFTVSGGARGVDQICHRVSVRRGFPTVAFLPSGLNEIYPSNLNSLVPSILKTGGALVSEYLPEVLMRKEYFPRRNRLIAGMARACLIVEARHRSGTMITALQAAEQAKPLFVLPSHPYDHKASGGLDLMMDGATPVRNAEDLISFMSAECKGISLPH